MTQVTTYRHSKNKKTKTKARGKKYSLDRWEGDLDVINIVRVRGGLPLRPDVDGLASQPASSRAVDSHVKAVADAGGCCSVGAEVPVGIELVQCL